MGALTTAWSLRQAVVQERDMTMSPTKPSKPLCGKDDPGSFVERPVDLIGGGG